MSANVIIDGVTKRYSKARDSGGVFDVNTEIPAGKFTTLLGESGSGKTTLLRLLAGFLRPDTGTITLGGRPVAAAETFVPTQVRDLAMVFQSYALWPHMSVFDNVAFGLKAQKVPKHEVKSRVEATLSLVGLEAFEGRKPAQLSGGQQQRVALARSLVLEPSLLLLDEPLSNLDADLRIQMRNQLKALQMRTGISFVYVTHDQEEAFALSDHMIVLDQGRILQQGDCLEIYSRPRSSKVAEFMGRRGLHLEGSVDHGGAAFRVTSPTDMSLGGFPHMDDRLRRGGDATLVVHSEDLVLCHSHDVPDGHVSIPGSVEAISFAGRENHVDVLPDTGARTTAYAGLGERWAVGEKLQIAFPRGAAWIFPRESDAQRNQSDNRTDAASVGLAEATHRV